MFSAAGEELPADDYPDLLGKERVVLVSTDGKPVAAFYRDLYKPDTLFVVAPADKAAGGPVPPPEAPPAKPAKPAERKENVGQR